MSDVVVIIHCPRCGAALEAKPVVRHVDVSTHFQRISVDFLQDQIDHKCPVT